MQKKQEQFKVPSEGTLLKGPQSNIYIMENAKKRFIPGGINGTTFQYNKFNPDDIRQLTEAELDAIPDGSRIPEVATRELKVETNSGAALEVVRELAIPQGWTYLEHTEKVTQGGHGMNGDGGHNTEIIEGPTGQVCGKLRITVTVKPHLGGKRNYYKVVTTVYIQKEAQNPEQRTRKS
jgi:hypothetical protein